MGSQNLKMSKNKITINRSSDVVTLFMVKSGDIHLCIDQDGSCNNFKLSHESCQVMGQKMLEIAQASKNKKNEQEADIENADAFHYSADIKIEDIDSVLDEILEKNRDC